MTEVRYCPLGPPRQARPVMYALCSECEMVRKSNQNCPLVDVAALAETDPTPPRPAQLPPPD